MFSFFIFLLKSPKTFYYVFYVSDLITASSRETINVNNILFRKHEGREHLAYVGVDEMIISKLI